MENIIFMFAGFVIGYFLVMYLRKSKKKPYSQTRYSYAEIERIRMEARSKL